MSNDYNMIRREARTDISNTLSSQKVVKGVYWNSSLMIDIHFIMAKYFTGREKVFKKPEGFGNQNKYCINTNLYNAKLSTGTHGIMD
jgi:hypothetical protein